jgi:hypothetical protein
MTMKHHRWNKFRSGYLLGDAFRVLSRAMRRRLRVTTRISTNFEAERDSAEHLNLARPAARRSFPYRIGRPVSFLLV